MIINELRPLRAGVCAVVLILALSGCGATPADSSDPPPPTSSASPPPPVVVVAPPTTGAFDYQLGGAYDPVDDITIVVRDSTEMPMEGIYSICYVNGFQTQPGETADSSLILRDADGAPIVDPNWPDEDLIDISSPERRSAAAARLQTTIDSCAEKGFAAVEFDNLDSWTRSGGLLTEDDAIEFATMLVGAAHEAGLAAGQKNAAELSAIGKNRIGFDFVISEECDVFAECEDYTSVYGAYVLNVEYADDLRGDFASVCARASTPRLTTLRDRDLVPPSEKAHVYAHC
ncbi:endo alpha-1,4 polygalactosaminidase [Microbacterium sp. P02]|uniref:endo alpha-1,4 polygalactosaminidase n=1 Tax=Microbacterium sp. P02 TaxID=3366260 RepID=UPI00366F49DC